MERSAEPESEPEREPKRIKLKDATASVSGIDGNDVVGSLDNGDADAAEIAYDDKDDVRSTSRSNSVEGGVELKSEWEEHCTICLQPFLDRAILPTCAHEFCFECILLWAEQSRKCPLCNRPFDSSPRTDPGGSYLIHHLRSRYDYQKYFLPPRPSSPSSPDPATDARSGLRDRNQLQRTIRRRRERQWGSGRAPRAEEQECAEEQLEQAIARRRWVYEWGLYAKHVASNQHTRYKPFPTPSLFASSPDLISRMTMWLRRELRVWPNMDVEFLTLFTVSLMKSIDIRSESAIKLLAEFLDMDEPYVEGARHTNAEHFAHEIYCYLRSPYRDLAMYDQMVQYDTPPDLPRPHHIEVGNLWTHDSPHHHSYCRHRSQSRSRSRSRSRSTSRHLWSHLENGSNAHRNVGKRSQSSPESNRCLEDERDNDRSASSSARNPAMYSAPLAQFGSACSDLSHLRSSHELQAQGESYYACGEGQTRRPDRKICPTSHPSTSAVHIDGSIDQSFLPSITNLNLDPSSQLAIRDKRDVKGKRREIIFPTCPAAGETVDGEAGEKGTRGTGQEHEKAALNRGGSMMIFSTTTGPTDVTPADPSPCLASEAEHTPTDSISTMSRAPTICNPVSPANNTGVCEQKPRQRAVPINGPSRELSNGVLSRGQRGSLRERVLAHLQHATRRRESPVQEVLNEGSGGRSPQLEASSAVGTMSRKRPVRGGGTPPSLLARLSDSPTPSSRLSAFEHHGDQQNHHSRYASSSFCQPSESRKKFHAPTELSTIDDTQLLPRTDPSNASDVRSRLLRKLEEEQRQLLFSRPRSGASPTSQLPDRSPIPPSDS
ncbi:hypothetical protein BKA83DRAFT_4315417 [Pisolithus microcarpus]|nr:hypothetical protein BKA83DRAFT_4315417 [Pisolithus microcarpus]